MGALPVRPSPRRLRTCPRAQEAVGNKGVDYYEARRERVDEFEMGRYDVAEQRLADPLWLPELGSDCIDAPVEPTAQQCCQLLATCNVTSVRILNVDATPSDFCSQVVWASGAVVVCGADGSATVIQGGVSGAPAAHVAPGAAAATAAAAVLAAAWARRERWG